MSLLYLRVLTNLAAGMKCNNGNASLVLCPLILAYLTSQPSKIFSQLNYYQMDCGFICETFPTQYLQIPVHLHYSPLLSSSKYFYQDDIPPCALWYISSPRSTCSSPYIFLTFSPFTFLSGQTAHNSLHNREYAEREQISIPYNK